MPPSYLSGSLDSYVLGPAHRWLPSTKRGKSSDRNVNPPKAAASISNTIFAISGSSRFSPRNNHVAEALARAGYASLLFDLLSAGEGEDRHNVFDIPALAERLGHAIDWSLNDSRLTGLPVGLFGASTGSAAALMAAAARPDDIGAVVSRGGRPDLALAVLPQVRAATLLLVGSRDVEVLRLNQLALARLNNPKRLQVVPGASHLFAEPGALDVVVRAATDWFAEHCSLPPEKETARE